MVPIPAEADEDGRRRGPGAIVFDGRHQRFGGRLDGALGFDARKARYLSGRRPTRVNSICSKRASSVLLAFLTTKAVVPGMVSRGYGRLIYLIAGLSRRPRDGMITRTTLRRPWTNSCGMSPWSWRHTDSPPTWSHRPRCRDPGRPSNSRPSGCTSSLRPLRWDGSSVPTMWPRGAAA